MDVQDQLVKATFKDLDEAPHPAAGKMQPDEFDVKPNVSDLMTFAPIFIHSLRFPL